MTSKGHIFINHKLEELTKQKDQAKRKSILALLRQPLQFVHIRKVIEVYSPRINLVLTLLDVVYQVVQEEGLEKHEDITHEVASH